MHTINVDDDKPIDFVLVYSSKHKDLLCRRRRDIFIKNLIDEGLIIQIDKHDTLFNFVKIHAPREVLERYCEILKVTMPMKNIPEKEYVMNEDNYFYTILKKLYGITRVGKLDQRFYPKEQYKLTAEFSRERQYLFDLDDPNFFSHSTRSAVVAFILDRKKFNNNQSAVLDFGIHRLISEGTFKAAYPLHDGKYTELGTQRNLLYRKWAQLKNWNRYQPIENIKNYFGEKFALYFAWLGFYTYTLLPMSIIGILCFIFGLVSNHSNLFSNDICDGNLNITMCPLCDYGCDYWKLEQSCLQAKITYVFDNNFTVLYASLMSLWATLYLEFWKRHSADIRHRWGLTTFDIEAEHPRPEYLAQLNDAKKKKLNVVTNIIEPSVSFWRVRLPYTLLSYSAVTVVLSFAFGAVFSVILYRMSQSTSRSIFGKTDNTVKQYFLLPVSAAIVNLIFITILNSFYGRLAMYLTDKELLRTQTEVDDSITLKIYLFQFVNYYSSIFYIAFIKGKHIGYPMEYIRIFGYRQEECSPGGCSLEVFIQLAIIMIGKKAVKNVIEKLILFYKSNKVKYMMKLKGEQDKVSTYEEVILGNHNQWTADYNLVKWQTGGLFDEYLEMVIQYGFITIFASAFPLAPLCALLSNIFELRLDAKKYVINYRRPVPIRAPNIGVWFKIMDIIGKMSIVTNAFLIAFTTNFIPRLVYVLAVSKDKTQKGFLEHSLAYFDVNDLEFGPPEESAFENITMCRYRDYRKPPWEISDDGQKYTYPEIYWHILAARLTFVVVFQNAINFLRIVVQWLIPDISGKLRDQIKRESYLTSEIIIKHEKLKSRMRHRTESDLSRR